MTDLIQADYDQLDSIAARFSAQAERTRETEARLKKAVQALDTGWEGRAKGDFTKEMNEVLFPAIQRLAKALADAHSKTRTISLKLREAEEEAARLFQAVGGSQAGQGTQRAKPTTPLALSDDEKRIYEWRDEIKSAAKKANVDEALVAALLLDEAKRWGREDDAQRMWARLLIPSEGLVEKLGVKTGEILGGLLKQGSSFKDVEFNMSTFQKLVDEVNTVQKVADKVGKIIEGEPIQQQSFGAAQMNVDAVQSLVDEGYITAPPGWNDDKLDKSLGILLNEQNAPTLIAARLRQTIDHWQDGGVDISQRNGVLATLYSLGLVGNGGIHPNPQVSDRGWEVLQSYERAKEILNSR